MPCLASTRFVCVFLQMLCKNFMRSEHKVLGHAYYLMHIHSLDGVM